MRLHLFENPRRDDSANFPRYKYPPVLPSCIRHPPHHPCTRPITHACVHTHKKNALAYCAGRGRCNFQSRASTSWTPATLFSPRPKKGWSSPPVCGTETRPMKRRRCVAWTGWTRSCKPRWLDLEGRSVCLRIYALCRERRYRYRDAAAIGSKHALLLVLQHPPGFPWGQ